MGGADSGSGWRLRGYTVERLLGSGSFGDVWRAQVSGTGQPVALKRVRVSDADELRHAQDEAALLTALDHPHLVRLHAFVPADDAAVLVLDLAEGGSLADLLVTRGRLTPGEVITAVAPVAAALAYLHGEGVVHGDVSAANVLFTPDGSALLSDVGVARLVGDQREVACTPAYVDPAVAGGGVPGPPSDVFSLGAVALHALTGEPAWSGSTGTEVLADAAMGDTGDGPDFAERMERAGVPIAMAAVIARAMAIDPHRRGTAADLALDLRHSGEPAAVELAAGRRPSEADDHAPRVPSGPRHAARVGAPPPRTPDDAGRPVFERPSGLSTVAASAPPTRMVGPRPRPVVPRPSGGARRILSGRRIVLVGCTALVAVLLAAGGTVWAATRSETSTDRRHAAARSGAVPTSAARTSTAPTSTSSPTVSPRHKTPEVPRSSAPDVSPARLPTSAHEAAAVLDALDRIRADAFRSRDIGLLEKVYVAGPLRSADTAMVERIVPRGCGLVGVRTRYAGVRIAASGPRVVVSATATMSTSRLMCGAAARGTAAGAGPVSLRIDIVRTAAGVRIAALRVR